MTYSYILFDSINRIFRATSDVCVLWGVWKVQIRYRHLRPSITEHMPTLVTTVIAILLWILAIYHLCLLFAVCFAWLYCADLDVINGLMNARNAIEFTFTAALFLGSLGTVWQGVGKDILVRERVAADYPYTKVYKYSSTSFMAQHHVDLEI